MLMSRIFATVALATATDDVWSDDNNALSLLQLRSSPVEARYNSSMFSGHPFGCTGRTKAISTQACGSWGDVHQHGNYNRPRGFGGGDWNGNGWYWMAKSKDDSFQAQAFVREQGANADGGRATISHFAFKFGDQTLFIDRDRENGNGNWAMTYYWNGERVDVANTPREVGGVYWAGHGDQIVNQGSAHAAFGQASRKSCFEYKGVSIWTHWTPWMGADDGPYAHWSLFELEGESDFLDTGFGQCAMQSEKVKPEDMLVTKEQNDKACRENKLSPHQCDDPTPPVEPKTKEQLCEENGLELSHAQDLCADQQAHSADIYEGCLYDVCASDTPEAEANAVAGAELESETVNPEAQCVVKSDMCEPCDICASATPVDLSNVVQNNLGGLGPDTGAEEIRYKNAMDVNGKKIDVVLTAEGAYKSPKPAKNGYIGDGFGRFLMKTKASTSFKFTFQDSATGQAVAVKDVALTFYDLDEAKGKRQRETVSVCGAKEAYTTSDTELEHKAVGLCHSFTSTTKGTGKDNPTIADDITKTQAARSVTYEFHSKASISFSAALSRAGRNPRPFLFSFAPVTACGASDGETKCAA